MMVRNWIRTGVLERISKVYHVVLLTPFANDRSFAQKFSTEALTIEELPFKESILTSSARRLFSIAGMRRFLKTYKIDTLFFKEQMLKQSRPLYYLFRSLIDKFNRKGLLERIGKTVWRRFWSKNTFYSNLLEQYKPIAVLSTHPYLETEWPLLLHAQKNNIPLYAFIHSWDNPTSRGELPCHFSGIMVWSKFVKERIMEYHPWLKHEDVTITGAPQYDLFVNEGILEARDSFFSRHGLNPERKLITFASGGPLFRDEAKIINKILSAMKRGDLADSVQLWIRPYGGIDFRDELPLSEFEHDVVYQQAPAEFWGAFRVEKYWKGNDEDLQDYVNLLYHSALVVCAVSTVTMDACVLDKPVINTAFDIGARDFIHSTRKFNFGFSHYQPVVRSGAIRTAMTPKELINYLNEYLENPTLHRDTRRSLVAELCGPVDGKTAERLASTIIETLNKLTPIP